MRAKDNESRKNQLSVLSVLADTLNRITGIIIVNYNLGLLSGLLSGQASIEP